MTQVAARLHAGFAMRDASDKAFEGSIPIKEWERLRHLSHTSAYRMLARGQGPRTYKIGRLRFVSAEADSEWLRKQESAA